MRSGRGLVIPPNLLYKHSTTDPAVQFRQYYAMPLCQLLIVSINNIQRCCSGELGNVLVVETRLDEGEV